MQDLVKGQFEWHNTVNTNFHELDTKKVDNNNLVESTGYGVVTGLEVSAQETPNMTVKVNAGIVYMPNGARLEFTGNDSVAISLADTENPRVDIVYINTDGTVGYIAGVPFTTPITPDTPEGVFLLAKINVAVGAASIVSGNITDMRKIKNNLDEHVVKKATQTDLGHVKKGTDINIDASGVISVDSGNAAGKILKLPTGLQKGDLLRVNASGQIERLPIGTDGQSIIVDNGIPTYGSPTNSKIFASVGTYSWTVPSGVNIVYITGCGAGGGGASGGGGGGGYGNLTSGTAGSPSNAGNAGGVTSFGSLLTLSGGGGGTTGSNTQGAAGNGSTSAVAGIGAVGGSAGSANSGYLFLSSGQQGNTGINGESGGSTNSNLPKQGAATKYTFASKGAGGAGGAGGEGGNWGGNVGGNMHGATGAGGAGGGTGAYCCRYPISVNSGDVITITIGTGGTGGSVAAGGTAGTNGTPYQGTVSTPGGSGTAGSKGGDGYMRIEW